MTEVSVRGRVGPDTLADGAEAKVRQGKSAEQIFTELHGRFYEQASRGVLFSGGIGLTAINNATYTTGTLGATCTPVLGVYNPGASVVNLVILQASLALTMTALQATGPAPFVWATSVGNTAISTGNQPLNRRTLLTGGSAGLDMSNVALTGLTTNLLVRHGSSLGGGSATDAAFLATAVAMQTQQLPTVENIDGGVIVPPGGVLALLATTTPVAHSAVASILWEEVPV
jgi:hypothetical protein